MGHRVVWLEGGVERVRRNVTLGAGETLPEVLPLKFGTARDSINGVQWRLASVDEYGEAFYRPEKVTK